MSQIAVCRWIIEVFRMLIQYVSILHVVLLHF